jgi:LPXTG-motif cell wall-anchored protein
LKELLTCKDSNGNDVDPGSITGHTTYSYSSNSDSGNKIDGGQVLGYTENIVPGVDNPYKDDYNYVDDAYFGRFDAEHLEEIFEKILEDVQLQSRYDFLLQEDTNIVMTDSIGDGMEVKGEPVLRYFGDNISATDRDTQTDGDVTYTDYYWKTTVNRKENSDAKSDEQSVDLSDVVARVSTNTSTGEQVVTLTIPEDVLPVFYPDSNRNFYFEELPLRLIYRVGLTETEEQALADSFDNNEYAEGTYYTNKYDGNTAGTTVTFYPDDGNPYYANLGDGKSVNKKENTTGTVATAFSEYYDKDKGVVTQYLGNNGKLEVSKDNTLTVDVEKCWISDTGEHPDSVDVYLYVTGTKVSSSGDSTDFTYYKDVATLNDANDWKKSWTRLRRKEVDGDYTYNYDVYYVVEAVPDGYAASYTDALGNELEKEEVPMVVSVPRDSISSADDESVQAMSTENMVQPMSLNGFVQKTIYINAVSANSGKVVITNRTSYKLPSSGGIGDTAMSLGAFASVILVVFLFLKRKRNTEI